MKPDTFFVALKILDGEGEIVFKCGRGGMEGRAECLETTDRHFGNVDNED